MMSENRRLGQPYKQLGERLKSLRINSKQTIAEVSGAVEIDSVVYERIELGEQRPAEDILALLISYFNIKDEEATAIWQLAGYDDGKNPAISQSSFELNQPIAMIMPMDQRVVYTDMVHVTVNNFGVIMNFMQGSAPNTQPLAVARIGMSKEHARSVIDILQQSLKQSDLHDAPKLLDSQQSVSDQADKTNDQK
jgi:transcriptional regulator with XRE-family HTH domain